MTIRNKKIKNTLAEGLTIPDYRNVELEKKQNMATNTGKSKQKKKNVRVDFTPMVDMNMLLITFFMLCTSLVKPQTMELAMPSNDKNIQDQDRSEVKASQAVTILLDADNKISLYVRYTDLQTGENLEELINKNK